MVRSSCTAAGKHFMMNSSPTPEERIWAVISHISALAFGMGLVLPIIGWSEQRNKSKYATFQCLQALGYQSLGYTLWLLSYLVLAILFMVLVVLESFLAENNGSSSGTLGFVEGSIFLFFFFGLFAVYMLLPVVAAVACAFGRNFRYPLVGTRLARYLGYGPGPGTDGTAPLNDEHQERWVAAMGHFSVILLFWGVLAPLTTWILQRKQNTFLRFQSAQTSIYQVFVNLLYLGATFLSFAGMLPFAFWFILDGSSDSSAPGFMLGLVLLLLSLLIAFVTLFVIPLFHILGQWAGYRVLKGDNYRYPILGKLVEKRLAKSYGVQELAPGASGKALDSIKEIP
jgi:uncharacterized Tic20 family protein